MANDGMGDGGKVGKVCCEHLTERLHIENIFLAQVRPNFFQDADNIAQDNFINVTKRIEKKEYPGQLVIPLTSRLVRNS